MLYKIIEHNFVISDYLSIHTIIYVVQQPHTKQSFNQLGLLA